MRVKFLIVFICVSVTCFSQTDKFLDEYKDLSVDSVQQAILLKDVLKNVIKYEFPKVQAYEKYNEAGIISYSKNYTDFAKEFFLEALQIARDIEDYDKIAQMLSNIGVMSELQGDYGTALKNYQASLQAFIESDNVRSQSLVYNNIAIIHQELGNIEPAYENLLKSYNIKASLGDSALIAPTLNNFGVYYEESVVDLDSALYYYSQALQLFNALHDVRNQALCFNNIAVVYYKMHNYDKAEEYFQLSIPMFKDLDDKLMLGKALIYFSQVKKDNSDSYDVISLLEEAKGYLLEVKYANGIAEASENLANAYYITGEYEKSAVEYRFLKSLQDSLLNIEKQTEINRLEVKFQSIQNQVKIDRLLYEKALQTQRIRQIVAFVVAVLFLFGLIILVLLMRGRQKKLLLENKNMIVKQNLLQKQMNPHFLFNVLTSIQTYIADSKIEDASAYLSKFSKLTRIVLQSSLQEEIPLADEMQLLKSYIELEYVRMNKSFVFEIDDLQIIDIDDVSIPPMMVQPFVENAIKHGLSKVTNARLILKVFLRDNEVEFWIIDNGPGIQKTSNIKNDHKSMALEIIEQRILILKQKWKRNVKVEYFSDEMGTKVALILPII
ncbi:MAG: tetratricopeptide repeat protein [Bacteroidales bacterium]|nr:tetratricopeptide repeat protein [Bacteroidales bacterium]